jgi:hypothetical protein
MRIVGCFYTNFSPGWQFSYIDFIGRNVDIGGPSTEWWSQLATAVAGGLAFATVLTLVLTPCMLALKARIDERKSIKNFNSTARTA